LLLLRVDLWLPVCLMSTTSHLLLLHLMINQLWMH